MNKKSLIIIGRKKMSGFTLLEVLLGLTIFGMIAACVYGTFAGGMRLSRSAERQGKVYREARWSLDVISKDLENMVPYDFSNSYKDRQAFEGDEHKVTFFLPAKDGLRAVSYYLASPESGSIYKIIIGRKYSRNVTVTNQDGPGGSRVDFLIRKERSFADYLNGDPEDKSTVEIISKNVKMGSLKFSFGYLENEESSVSTWKNEWKYSYIPSNVKVQMAFVLEQKDNDLLEVERDVLVPPGFWGISQD